MEEAIQQSERLLEGVMAAKPDVEHDLRDAYSLSLLYEGLARLYRANASADRADAADAEACDLDAVERGAARQRLRASATGHAVGFFLPVPITSLTGVPEPALQ